MDNGKVIATFTLSEEECIGEPAGLSRKVKSLCSLMRTRERRGREKPNAAFFKALAEQDRRMYEENLVFDSITGEQIIINPNGKKGAKLIIDKTTE